jgi:hypothetical protein
MEWYWQCCRAKAMPDWFHTTNLNVPAATGSRHHAIDGRRRRGEPEAAAPIADGGGPAADAPKRPSPGTELLFSGYKKIADCSGRQL